MTHLYHLDTVFSKMCHCPFANWMMFEPCALGHFLLSTAHSQMIRIKVWPRGAISRCWWWNLAGHRLPWYHPAPSPTPVFPWTEKLKAQRQTIRTWNAPSLASTEVTLTCRSPAPLTRTPPPLLPLGPHGLVGNLWFQSSGKTRAQFPAKPWVQQMTCGFLLVQLLNYGTKCNWFLPGTPGPFDQGAPSKMWLRNQTWADTLCPVCTHVPKNKSRTQQHVSLC